MVVNALYNCHKISIKMPMHKLTIAIEKICMKSQGGKSKG